MLSNHVGRIDDTFRERGDEHRVLNEHLSHVQNDMNALYNTVAELQRLVSLYQSPSNAPITVLHDTVGRLESQLVSRTK